MTTRSPDVGATWRVPVVLLGFMTIGAYGLVLYGFGAFVAPIRDDTGWSNGSIAAAFSTSTFLGGLLSLWTGHLLDRIGSRTVMITTLAAGSGLLVASSLARLPPAFVTAWGLGGAVVSAGLYYNVTMAVTARITTSIDRPRAFTWLTVIGGLASPVAFPLAALFVEWWGWRTAIRAMVIVMVICCAPAIVLVRDTRAVRDEHDGDEHHGDEHDGDEHDGDEGLGSLAEALRSRAVLRWLVTASAALAGLGAIQVHHVAAIEATGVALGTASLMAAIRGLLSLPGRAGAAALTRRIGTISALRLVYLVLAAGTAALAGGVGGAWVFVVVTGLAFGSLSPLQGLHAADLYGRRRIGTLLGMQQVVLGAAMAIGPLALGATVDLTGGYGVLVVLAVALQFGAWAAFRPISEPG
ncbi:MAG: MFS transporter [Ilumatobacteraceae bacterium]